MGVSKCSAAARWLTWTWLLLVLLTAPVASATDADAIADTMVILVRHGEKATDDPKDPSLSVAGQARAQALARVLAGSRLAAVQATQYRRTQMTAQPAATAAALQIEVVEASADAALAKTWAKELLQRWQGRTVLVVGHSNTVPLLVQALSGQAVDALGEQDYDRLFLVSIDAAGQARLVQSRYGAP